MAKYQQRRSEQDDAWMLCICLHVRVVRACVWRTCARTRATPDRHVSQSHPPCAPPAAACRRRRRNRLRRIQRRRCRRRRRFVTPSRPQIARRSACAASRPPLCTCVHKTQRHMCTYTMHRHKTHMHTQDTGHICTHMQNRHTELRRMLPPVPMFSTFAPSPSRLTRADIFLTDLKLTLN